MRSLTIPKHLDHAVAIKLLYLTYMLHIATFIA